MTRGLIMPPDTEIIANCNNNLPTVNAVGSGVIKCSTELSNVVGGRTPTSYN